MRTLKSKAEQTRMRNQRLRSEIDDHNVEPYKYGSNSANTAINRGAGCGSRVAVHHS
eukprot:IDg7735t1